MKRPSVYVTALIAGAFFMENLDDTIIATALNGVGHSKSTPPDAYLLAGAMG